MSNIPRSPFDRRRLLLLALIAAVGVCLSLLAYVPLSTKDTRLFSMRLEADADQRVKAIDRRFRMNVGVIHGLTTFVRAGQPGSRDEFQEAAERIFRVYNDVRAVYWIPYVTPDRRAVYAQAAEGLGLTGFQFRELSAEGQLQPAVVSDERNLLPIYFAAPMDRQQVLLGLDLLSVPALEEPVAEAIASGRATISTPIRWPDDPQGGKVFFNVRAVYSETISADEPHAREVRQSKLLGLLAVSIRVDAMLVESLSVFGDGLDVLFYDAKAPDPDRPLCAYRSRTNSIEFLEPAADEAVVHRLALPAFALDPPWQRWSVSCQPTTEYLVENYSLLPLLSLGFGLVLTVILTTYANTLLGRAEKVRQLVIQRTSELDYERFLLETLLAYSPDYIYFKDRDSRFLRISRALANYYGLDDPAATVGKSDNDFFDSERVEQYRADEVHVMATGQPIVDKEETGIWPDGRIALLSTTKVPLRNHQGDIVGTFGISRDITSRKRAEEEAEYERYLLHSLMDSVPDSIYFKDADGRYIRINKAKAERSGFRNPAEAIGKSDADVFPEAHVEQARRDEQQVIATGQPMIGKEEHLTWPGGKQSWVATTRLPLRDREGNIVGTFGISHDITAQKKAAEQMRKAKEAAEAASRAKGDFLANMSHEIRTPLNAVIGMTELVLDTELTASQREYLQLALDSSESLLSVINDILDFSKIEAGKLALESAEFELRESLGDALKSLAFRAHRKGLELAANIHPDVPERLIGDAGRLRQILVNLVGNAIKFTETGEIIVEVCCASQTQDQAELYVSVRDTGIGIPADKLTHIFEAFEQVDTSTTRKFGGTGLGLAICSRLVALMGRRIWVDSELDRGSTFHFTVRFDLAHGEPLPKPPVVVQGTRVLVVDDNATNRRILDEILLSWDMQPQSVAGACEAMRVLREAFRSGNPFPLVVTDAAMPDVDGFALAEQIKQDEEIGSTVIMMLTSGDRPGEVARCEQLGIAAYLLKPIKQSELFDAVVTALGVNAVDEQTTETPAPPQAFENLPPLRVLLAEDSTINQKLAVALLEKHGHRVTVAADGREALAAFDAQPFDLVLMDVQMPEVDGYEATRAIRARERGTGRHVPIIAITAHAMKGDRERCLQAGMDAYVTKPIRAKQLFAAIAAAVGT